MPHKKISADSRRHNRGASSLFALILAALLSTSAASILPTTAYNPMAQLASTAPAGEKTSDCTEEVTQPDGTKKKVGADVTIDEKGTPGPEKADTTKAAGKCDVKYKDENKREKEVTITAKQMEEYVRNGSLPNGVTYNPTTHGFAPVAAPPVPGAPGGPSGSGEISGAFGAGAGADAGASVTLQPTGAPDPWGGVPTGNTGVGAIPDPSPSGAFGSGITSQNAFTMQPISSAIPEGTPWQASPAQSNWTGQNTAVPYLYSSGDGNYTTGFAGNLGIGFEYAPVWMDTVSAPVFDQYGIYDGGEGGNRLGYSVVNGSAQPFSAYGSSDSDVGWFVRSNASGYFGQELSGSPSDLAFGQGAQSPAVPFTEAGLPFMPNDPTTQPRSLLDIARDYLGGNTGSSRVDANAFAFAPGAQNPVVPFTQGPLASQQFFGATARPPGTFPNASAMPFTQADGSPNKYPFQNYFGAPVPGSSPGARPADEFKPPPAAPPPAAPPPAGPPAGPPGGGNDKGEKGGGGGMPKMPEMPKGGGGGAPKQPAQQCSSDQNVYAQQQQQYQQALQQYNYQLQQYNYQVQLNQYYGSSAPTPPPPAQPSPCTPSTGTQCQSQPQQPAASGCSVGSWRATYSGTCVAGWQCIPSATSTSPTSTAATLTCAPEVADVGMPINISYSCAAGTASSTGFTVTTQPSGTTTATIANPPAGANTATYALMCSNEGKTAGAQCSVQINKPSIILVANPKSVVSGRTSLIGWTTTGMNACVISSPADDQALFTYRNSSNTSKSGAAETSAITKATTFVLTCETMAGAIKSASISVGVSGQGGVITVSSNASATVKHGDTIAITWEALRQASSSAVSLWLSDVLTGSTTPLIKASLPLSGTYSWQIPAANSACSSVYLNVCGADLVVGGRYAIEADVYTPADAYIGDETQNSNGPDPEWGNYSKTNAFTIGSSQ
ncbi:hypothetical protein A2763_02760 [Candidatus Kaiserbacteria bacterium RIFCSPHIGHO2_01_FULL_54_36]|uniref:Ig-like domain-containing protein n=1 Tax=Candidatus Kaiserbacteria bacterium RIFCSPHIGHO2_01_FULL_54_36 TaxID=1798482 RepID=A0A1F6CP36_9BACT|nr:MAG: hypothetical protein A2763_02760 [Candidatus Kaiserbacteria bacterium RIFCSPHIGHO2_01_FULL_54_36]OGG75238.1 MAG: hypothetical protein A3A41_03900 [Candidatus Kaiserbacteria bacterium RIFCSPLOWO2_01_FULL_54_22]